MSSKKKTRKIIQKYQYFVHILGNKLVGCVLESFGLDKKLDKQNIFEKGNRKAWQTKKDLHDSFHTFTHSFRYVSIFEPWYCYIFVHFGYRSEPDVMCNLEFVTSMLVKTMNLWIRVKVIEALRLPLCCKPCSLCCAPRSPYITL